jgi:adenylylsulfate kinase
MSERDKNIIQHHHLVNRNQRERLNNHRSCMILFTGLSGAGKSTLAGALEELLFERGIRTYLLDGDNVRKGINSDLGFDLKDRSENLRRISEISKLMVDAGIVVLAAFISPLQQDRAIIRSKFGNDDFFEIYVDADLTICESRDTKGLYAKARQGLIPDFTGISSPYEIPANPSYVAHTGIQSLQESSKSLLDFLLPHIKL